MMLSARSRLKELSEPEGDDVGILFPGSPAEKIAVATAKRERRRRKIIKELFETEKAYLNHLDLIHKHFYFTLRFNCLLPEDKHAILFSNIEQIRNVNRKLLELMEQSSIGQAFKHLGPFLKLYSMYANNYQQALAVLQEMTLKNSEFAEFIQTQEALPDVMGLKINALLITPVQRIPRYKLLLEDLLSHTPGDNLDYAQLKEATKQIGEIAHHINEHIRQHENFQKMLSIQKSLDRSAPKILQPGRIFIKEGSLKKVSRKGDKSFERMFFLFNDVLLYGKPKLVESGGRSYTCCCVLPIKHCKLERVFVTSAKHQSDSCVGGGVFKITCKEESLVLYSDDTRTAESWSNVIEKAIRKANDDRQTLRKPSSNKIPLRGRSLRKHQQQQKKSGLQTQSRRQNRTAKPHPKDKTKDCCCSPGVQKHVEPLRERMQSLYDNLPMACATPPRPQTHLSASVPQENNFSAISDGADSFNMADDSSGCGASQRGSVFVDEDNNFDSFADHDDLYHNSDTDNRAVDSAFVETSQLSHGSLVSTANGTQIYYPAGSTLNLNLNKPRVSVRSKIRSYLRRPFTRLQCARQTIVSHCSPFSGSKRSPVVGTPVRR